MPIAPGASAQVQLAAAGAAVTGAARWEGTLAVTTPGLGDQTVNLFYEPGTAGQWSGNVYYFGNFRDDGLDAWLADRTNDAALGRVRNAFMARWGAYRNGTIGIDELRAVIAATVRGDLPDRAAGCSQAACYPLTSASGVTLQPYTDNTDNTPIPSGVTDLPITINLQAGASARVLSGVIVSKNTLQYGGSAALSLGFAADPTACGTRLRSACVAFLSEFAASLRTGARYRPTTPTATCAPQFTRVLTPWLVPGFTAGTVSDPTVGVALPECRDTLLPYTASAPEVSLNPFLAGANPVADGRSRARTIELVDGVLVDSQEMLVIFRERLDTFLGTSDRTGFRAYGVMMLRRTGADLVPADYVGNNVSDTRATPASGFEVTCDPALLTQVYRTSTPTLSAANAREIAVAMLDGNRPGVASPTPASVARVHYYCSETGLFDGGASLASPVSCPPGSAVTYFLADRDNATIAADPCNSDRSCGERLAGWRDANAYGVRLDPVWRCTSATAVSCDDNRLDLRVGKTFFDAGPTEPAFVPLSAAMDSAFRYRTRFRSRSGAAVGFAPRACTLGATTVPYCYDAAEIERVRGRIDCLQTVFNTQYAALDSALQTRVRGELEQYYGYRVRPGVGGAAPTTDDGFERLYAQTLIMLGDDAYTRAFGSRFDLSSSRPSAFVGSRFEPEGVDVSGPAGAELYALYQAGQYYQLVLDRFFKASPAIWTAIAAGPGTPRNYITQATVIAYFDRVIRASVQKSRAASEIAKRYQRMAKPLLARTVIERAYGAAYLESIILSRMLLSAVEIAEREQRDQIRETLNNAQRTFNVALSEMRDAYPQTRDATNVFGFEPNYVPFPALDPGDVNAFTRVMGTARNALANARTAEEQAIASSRSYETDATAFQNELVRVRNNYEGQLSQVCGTFRGDDRNVYPAVPRYASNSADTRVLRDPCGLVGNGQLSDAMTRVELARIDTRGVLEGYDRLFAEIEIERQRASSQCRNTLRLADFVWQQAGRENNLQASIAQSQAKIRETQHTLEQVREVANAARCSGLIGCITGLFSTGVSLLAGDNATRNIESQETKIANAQQAIREIERNTARFRAMSECDAARIDSNARVATLMLRLKELDLDVLRQDYRTRLALSEVSALRNQASRLMAEQEEAEEIAINAEAARNDPNVRVYRNDAVITADRTFLDALREAYRATRVFEYYSSQSYARADALYSVRLVSRGDYSLERYFSELESAYELFRENYGTPSTRVAVVSLRDDVLSIPRIDGGRALTQTERITRFRQALTSGDLLDGSGYLTMPFSTSIGQLSPLTRNHKVLYIEAEVIGSNVGDTVGRVYLRQAGTGIVNPLEGSPRSYQLPERTAVMNTFFNGVRVFTPEVYRNDRLRDRPYVNSRWEFVLNQRDELVNQDVDLDSLSDVRLYIYYSDFTAL